MAVLRKAEVAFEGVTYAFPLGALERVSEESPQVFDLAQRLLGLTASLAEIRTVLAAAEPPASAIIDDHGFVTAKQVAAALLCAGLGYGVEDPSEDPMAAVMTHPTDSTSVN